MVPKKNQYMINILNKIEMGDGHTTRVTLLNITVSYEYLKNCHIIQYEKCLKI